MFIPLWHCAILAMPRRKYPGAIEGAPANASFSSRRRQYRSRFRSPDLPEDSSTEAAYAPPRLSSKDVVVVVPCEPAETEVGFFEVEEDFFQSMLWVVDVLLGPLLGEPI